MTTTLTNYLNQLFNMMSDIGSNNIKATFPEPDGAGGAGDAITLTANAAADTWGAWIQIVATVGVNPVHLTGLYISNPSANVEYTIQIGVGTAPAGVQRFSEFFRSLPATPVGEVKRSIAFPVRIAANAGLVGRVQSNQAVADTIDVKVSYYTNTLGT